MLSMQATSIPVRRHSLTFCLVLLVLLAPAMGYGYQDTVTQAHNARFQFLLDAAVRDGLTGVVLRVEGPSVDFHGAAGVANLNTGEVLTTKHAMYMASLGKTFTATVALQLCEQGRLELEAPITRWLSADVTRSIPSSEKIKLRHLLSHTSGLIDYMNDQKAWRSDFVSDSRRQWQHGDTIAYIYDKPLLFEPGTGFHYSNSNYILVGMIIEQVTGQPHHVLIRKRILEPLGLEQTFNGHETVDNNRAHGYTQERGRMIDTFPWYSHYGLADSGMHSTPGDMALFIRPLFGGEIISDAMRTQMLTVSGLGRPPSEYGMGIYVQHNPWGAAQRWYSHDGIDPGYQADMMHLPDHDMTVVLAANASMGRANIVYEKLIKAVVDVVLDTIQENEVRR